MTSCMTRKFLHWLCYALCGCASFVFYNVFVIVLCIMPVLCNFFVLFAWCYCLLYFLHIIAWSPHYRRWPHDDVLGCRVSLACHIGPEVETNDGLVMLEWKWNDWCFRPRLCTCKAILGRGQPALMRWIYNESCPWRRIDRSTCCPAVQHATTGPQMPPEVGTNDGMAI